MKKKSKIFILILTSILLLSSCVKRRISYLENRRESFLEDYKDKSPNKVEFNPDDLSKFKSIDDYLIWYKKLKEPAILKISSDKSEKKSLSQGEMIEDFNYFFEQIRQNYPFFGVLKRQYDIDFLANYSKYLNEIKFCKNDNEFIKTMKKIVGDLKNDHANIADRDYVEDSLVYYSHFWKDPSIYYEFLSMNQRVVRDRYGIKAVQSSENKQVKRQRIDPNYESSSKNLNLRNLGDGIGLIKIKKMLSKYELGEDMKELDKFLSVNKDFKVMVIDIRDNSGGNSEYWKNCLLPRLIDKKVSLDNHMFFKQGMRTKLLLESEEISYEDINKVNLEKMNLNHKEDLEDFSYYGKDSIEINPIEDNKFKGSLYLLVNDGVYSSAEGFANFCKNTKIAKLIGEKTGGDGITLGVINDVLPNSGLVFTYTNTLGYAPDGSINEESKTEPDIKTESFNDAIEIIKKMENIGD